MALVVVGPATGRAIFAGLTFRDHRQTASTDETDPPSSLTYDMLQIWAGDPFAVRYGVTGTQVSGFFVAAVKAVDPAGNRSESAFTTVL